MRVQNGFECAFDDLASTLPVVSTWRRTMSTQRPAVEFGDRERNAAASADAIQILFVGPGGLICEGIARILSELAHPSRVCCVENVAVALEHNAPADVVVLDGDLPREAAEVVNEVRDRMPSTPVVVLLATTERATVEKLLAAGCAGCVDKSASSGVLLGALRSVLAGGTYLPPQPLSLMDEKRISPPAHEQPTVAPKGRRCELTPRQIEVLALAARGESNKAIARQLNISEGTVKIHLTSVYKTLKVTSRSQATNVVMRDQAVIDERARRAFAGDISIARLMPHMTPRYVKADEVLFKKGDKTDALYYVVRGVVHLEEIGVHRGPGSLLGEIGFFTVGRRRTCTARCDTDCKLLVIKATDAMRIFYQDPDFAVYVMHLVTSRLEASRSPAQGI
jgi:DNA-binding NarL/FixJ family response regulator